MRQRSALIIEDVGDLAETFAEILAMMGWQAEYIQDGQLALEKLALYIPDLIMLDLHLPHISGLDILREIHSDPRLANTKILVVTADALRATQVAQQADCVLIKPILANQLIETVDRLMADNG